MSQEESDASGGYESARSSSIGQDDEDDDSSKTLSNMRAKHVKEHVEGIVEMIKTLTGGDQYTVSMEVEGLATRIFVNKKRGVSTHEAMVTPHFPVRMQLIIDAETGLVARCTGTLCSPLTSDVDKKMYRPCLNVPIGSIESLTDFLCLHLCCGLSVILYVLYAVQTMIMVNAQLVNDLQFSPVKGVGFHVTYMGKTVVLRILKNMEFVLMHDGGLEKYMRPPTVKPKKLGPHQQAKFGLDEADNHYYDAFGESRVHAAADDDSEEDFSAEKYDALIEHCFASPDGGDEALPLQKAMEKGKKLSGFTMNAIRLILDTLMFNGIFGTATADGA